LIPLFANKDEPKHTWDAAFAIPEDGKANDAKVAVAPGKVEAEMTAKDADEGKAVEE